MYTRVPVVYTISIMISMLRKLSIPEDTVIELKNLITMCLKDNICVFRNKTYKFPDSLLSSLVAEVYMNHIEEEIISSGHAGLS